MVRSSAQLARMSAEKRAMIDRCRGRTGSSKPAVECLEARWMFDSNPTFNYVEASLTPAQIYQPQSGTLQNFLITDGGTGDQSSYQVRTYKFTMPGSGSTPVRFVLSAANPQGLATKYS